MTEWVESNYCDDLLDPNCASAAAGSFELESPANIRPMTCGKAELDDFTNTNLVPAYVHTPSHPDEAFIRYKDTAGSGDGYDAGIDEAGEEFMKGGYYEVEFVPSWNHNTTKSNGQLYVAWNYSVEHNGYDGRGWDRDSHSSTYHFGKPLPAGTAVDLKFEFASIWTVIGEGREWGELIINAEFTDAAGTTVRQKQINIGAGYDDSKWSATYEWGYENGQYRHFVNGKYPELHFNNIEGATALILTLKAVSRDSLKEHTFLGTGQSDDTTADPSVWGGLESMTITCAVNKPPEARDDGTTANPVPINNTGSTPLGVLANDSDPDGDPLSIVSLTAPSHGTAYIAGDQIVYSPPASGAPATVSFRYTIVDPAGLTDRARVVVGVLQPDQEIGTVTIKMPGVPDKKGSVRLSVPGGRVVESPVPEAGLPYKVVLGPDTATQPKRVELISFDLPEGYQLAANKVSKDTEVKNFTDSPTIAQLGIDYPLSGPPPTNPPPGGGGKTGWAYSSCHYCHVGSAYTYIEEWHNGSYIKSYYKPGNTSQCTAQIEQNTMACFEKTHEAKPSLSEPGYYCSTRGSGSDCYPQTNWPEDPTPPPTSGPPGTCENWTTIQPYPNCRPPNQPKVYGYPNCVRKCVK